MTRGAQRILEVRASDDVLVERIRGGDERAFFALYSRYARFVAGIAYRLIGDNSEVDDVVQDTFIALDRGIHKLQDPSKVKSWLAIVATRVVRKRLGKRSRRRWLSRQAEEMVPMRSNPNDQDRVELLYQALEKLSPRVRVPWAMHRIEGATLPETAERCGVSLATVKRRISSAAEKLRKQLGEEWV
ncbi:MAG: RNA polymerase sigma factor [Deltaproteobacteria bacterium]|nr:RNA polymerase sigma factor [Deltaproteobacteria bacterium]